MFDEGQLLTTSGFVGRSTALKGEPLARQSASKTDVTIPPFAYPVRFFGSLLSSTPSLQRYNQLAG